MRSFALLVGVGRFENGLGNLEYIEQDVNEMSLVLQQHLEIPEDNIFSIIDSGVTPQSVFEVVNEILEKVSPGDRVIVYFATHGKAVYETPWLATYTAQNAHSGDTDGWINTGELFGKLHRAQCNVIGFLDSCQSTMFLARGVGSVAEESPSHYLPNQYSVIFAAAGIHEDAHSDREFEHGCWTYYLLTALKGLAPRSFAHASNRITVNSLQDYLVESVSYRVKDTYGKEQTPHVWGTRAEDVVINEYPGDQQMRISEIYFGEIDADSEKISSPCPEILAKNFYDLNEICSTLSSENAIQVIIGNKGTGKTFIGEYLGTNYPNMIYKSVGPISLADIKNISYAQSNQKGKYCEAWKYAIYTILACTIVADKRVGSDEFSAVLQSVYGKQYELLLNNPIRRKNILLRKQTKQGVRLSDEYSMYTEENGIASISNLIMLYEDLFNRYYDGERIYFLIDGLDDQLRGNLQEEQKAYLLDLLEAVQSSNDEIKCIRCVLLFRNDILKRLDEEANFNKTVTARSHILSWLPSDGNRINAPLYRFLEQRISTVTQYKTGVPLNLAQILPTKISSRDTWEWIMELTTYTPRDVIAFFNECKKIAGDQRCLTEDCFWNAARPYADYLWREMTDIMNGTCLSGKSEDLIGVFSKIADTHHVDPKSKTSFSFAEFSEAYHENENLSSIPISDAMKVLYESGVMCVHLKGGKTYWYFRENPAPYDKDLWREATFDLHKGLWKKMHIW